MGRCQGRKQECCDLGTGIVDCSLCARKWRWVLCVGTTPPGLPELLKAQVAALRACDALTIIPVPDKFWSQETHLGRKMSRLALYLQTQGPMLNIRHPCESLGMAVYT